MKIFMIGQATSFGSHRKHKLRWYLKRFHIQTAKQLTLHLGHHRLSANQCPTSKREKDAMKKVPYQFVVDSLMYVMVCTRPDIAHAIRKGFHDTTI
jgi:ATP-binding cassette subfamily B (MDR/TAP) protein 1